MSAVGTWQLKMMTPLGEQTPTITIVDDGGSYSGSYEGSMGSGDLTDVTVDGDSFGFGGSLDTPMGKIALTFSGTVEGDAVSGTVSTPMGGLPFTGERSG